MRLPVRLVADSAPRVDVPVPGADTLAPLSLQLPLVVDARDDHGVSGVVIESRRISRLGVVDSARRETIGLATGTTDRAILSYTLDLTRRGLLPGDTVRYRAVASDNTPQRQVGRSREYVLRLPTMSEVRAAERLASDAVSSRLDSVAAASRQLERQTDDLARERTRTTDARGEKSGESLPFEEAKKAEGVAQSQQAARAPGRGAQALARCAPKRSAEAAGVGDSAWQRELSDIREQIDRALSPELRERLQALQQALKDLDADRTKDALERLAEAQKETARGARAEPRAVPARRARGRSGQPEQGVDASWPRSSGEWNRRWPRPTAPARRPRSASSRRAPTRSARRSTGWASRWTARSGSTGSTPPATRPSRRRAR